MDYRERRQRQRPEVEKRPQGTGRDIYICRNRLKTGKRKKQKYGKYDRKERRQKSGKKGCDEDS